MKFNDLTDKTKDVKKINAELNPTDRIYDLPDSTRVKVRLIRRERNANSDAYTISVSEAGADGKAKPRGSVQREDALQAIEDGANPFEVFEVGPEHSLTMVIDGDVEVEKTLQDVIALEVVRFKKFVANRNKADSFLDTWSR